MGVDVTIANDADAAAWVNSTLAGIGGRRLSSSPSGRVWDAALWLTGKLLTGATGLAGEGRHVQVQVGGRPCPCGGRARLEQYASGPALARAARDRALASPASAWPAVEHGRSGLFAHRRPACHPGCPTR